MNRNQMLFGGVIYGLFVATLVYWLGAYLGVSGSDTLRVGFSIGVGALASTVFFASYFAGKRGGKDK